MTVLTNVPPPVDDPIAQPKRPQFEGRPDPQEGKITRQWLDYLISLGTAIVQSVSRIAEASITDEDATISPVDVTTGLIAAGKYEFTYYASITREAGTSSSLEVTLDWTDRGNAKSYTGPAIVDGAVTDSQFGGGLIRVDGASPVRYSTVYASAGAPTTPSTGR